MRTLFGINQPWEAGLREPEVGHSQLTGVPGDNSRRGADKKEAKAGIPG